MKFTTHAELMLKGVEIAGYAGIDLTGIVPYKMD
jgi:hypothetical protein